jgi:DNA-binding transcriptional LysR family regulator
MSNRLRRLRDLFNDPILIRNSQCMTPTERAEQLKPQIRDILSNIEKAVQPSSTQPKR